MRGYPQSEALEGSAFAQVLDVGAGSSTDNRTRRATSSSTAGVSGTAALPHSSTSTTQPYPMPSSSHQSLQQSAKRRYKRHPRPDENAPRRPSSAYVIFANDVREQTKDENHSFSALAKIVGERWKTLSPDQRDVYESQANEEKRSWEEDNEVYRRTKEYQEYQRYLAVFRELAASPHGHPERLEPPARLGRGRDATSKGQGRANPAGDGITPPPTATLQLERIPDAVDLARRLSVGDTPSSGASPIAPRRNVRIASLVNPEMGVGDDGSVGREDTPSGVSDRAA